jgi:DNA repair exonuclease SbcCD ATPase subunit
MSMQLKHISLKNIGPLKEKEIEIENGITAFVGQLGTGKTMALEAPYVTSFMEFATRNRKIQDYTRGEAEICTTWDKNGQKLEFLLNIDRDSLYGRVKINSAITSFATQAQYLDAIKDYFPSKSLWLSTILCAQTKVGSFVELTKTPRKEIFYQLLALGKYDAISAIATERMKALDIECGILEGKLNLINETILKYENSLQVENFQTLQKEAYEQKTKLDELSKEVLNYSEYHILKSQIENLNKEIESIKLEEVTSETKDFSVIRATKELALVSENINALQKDIEAYGRISEELNEIQLQANKEKINIPNSWVVLSEEDINSLKKNYTTLSDDINKYTTELRETERYITEIEAKHLYSPPCGDSFKECKLKAELVGLTQRLAEYKRKAALNKSKEDIQKLVIQKGEIEKKISEYDKISKSVWQLNALRESYKVKKAVLNKLPIFSKELVEIAKSRLTKLLSQKDTLSSNITLAVKYQEERTKHKTLSTKVKELTLQLAAIKYDENKEREYASLSQSLPVLNNKILVLSEKYTQVKELNEQKLIIETKFNASKQDMSEYFIINEMCGPNGIPSIEIDAVIPEVETLATILLMESGWNYKIRLETQKEGSQKEKNKYKILETMDVVIIDGNDALTKVVSDLSVGQRAIISEAISLALSIVAKQKGIIDMETLFRDETTSNLNREAANSYVKLLRNAMTIGEFKSIIYITHQDFLLSQMDHVVEF